MADRTVNININYKVNTDEVKKAADAAASAQKATDALKDSAKKAGSSIMQEFQKSNKSILEMQNTLTRLKSVIEVTSNPAKLKQLTAEYKLLKTQLDAATKSAFGLDKAMQSQGKNVQNLSSQFGKLYGAVQTVFGAAIVRQVVSTGLELAKLAGNAEGIQRAFERSFPNSVVVLNELREATHGTVQDVELMQRTLQATNLGVAIKELPILFEFAATRAQQTGESVDYLVDSIVRGIGRKSPLILDNLGLSATRLKEKFDGAALASQSVADVTRGVAEIAREELAKMGGYVETGATKVAQLEAAWETARIAFAKRIDSSAIVNFFTEAFKGLANALETEKEVTREKIRQRAAIEFQSLQENQLNEMRTEGGKRVKQTTAELINATQNEIRERMKLIEQGKVELLILKQKFDKHNDTGNATGKEVNDAIKAREEISKQGAGLARNLKFHEETIKLLRAYFEELKKGNDEEKVSTGIVERKREQIKKLQEDIEKTNRSADLGQGGKLTSQLEILQAELADLLRAFKDFHLKEFKLEVNDASKTLSNFGAVFKRVDADLRDGIELPPIKVPPPQFEPTFWDNLGDEVGENWREITSVGIDIQADQLKSLAEAEMDSMQSRLGALKQFYSDQRSLAGDNQRAKAELQVKEDRETAILQRKIFDREKSVRKAQALIDGAAAVIKAFVTAPNVYIAIIQAAFIAAQTASQIAIINRQQPRFAKGRINIPGPGTGTSDSINAKVSRGESVITAKRTADSPKLLHAIQDGKISDKRISEDILNKLHVTSSGVTYNEFDDSRIVNELRKQKPVDYMAHANLLWEVKTSADGLHKKIKRKSMGY